MIGTCRLLMIGDTSQFSRLAVDVRTAPARASRRRCSRPPTRRRVRPVASAWCSTPRPMRARSTSSAGYRARGREFTEAGIEHIAMEKRL